MSHSDELGSKPIGPLLRQQAVPAAIGILVMSIYGIVDTIFVGRWVGTLGIGAITVVLPITFLIASIGMAIGIGGASIISRAFGANDRGLAFVAFGNQVMLTVGLAILTVIIGSFYQEELLQLFGGKGDILPYAQEYFQIILYGVPFLAWAMMSNNVIRSEGQPKVAMMIMIVPAVVNMILDPIFIAYLDWGIKGAAWATTISYFASASFAFYYFVFGKSELRILRENLILRWHIVKEIFAIGGVTFARQGTISLLMIVLNNSLYTYGGELAIAIYGVINRVMMFANFPVLGVTQGFLPIAGYNYGANKTDRLKKVINLAIRYGTGIAFFIFLGVMLFAGSIVNIFTEDPTLIAKSKPALMICFIATPLITIQLVGSAYFQAIGKALPALLLTLTKQGFFLIPLILILPTYFGLNGVWYAFPLSDILATTVTFWYLKRATRNLTVLNEKVTINI